MNANTVQFAAFLSYSHKSDEHENLALTKFGEALEEAVEMARGRTDFKIFRDKRDLHWGDPWKSRIDGVIDDTTFLIPILTPHFFESPECKREVKLFLEREERLSRKDLILPVYYCECDVLQNNIETTDDEVIVLFKTRQYVDFRKLRFLRPSSKAYKKVLTKLAEHINAAITNRNKEVVPIIKPSPPIPVWLNDEPNQYIHRPTWEKEIIEFITDDKPQERIITLHASGGMGKTRLAKYCAVSLKENHRDKFKDGVYFVSLDIPNKSIEDVAAAISTKLKLEPSNDKSLSENLIANLCSKDMVLVLDNYESVASTEVGEFIRDLILNSPGLRLLVTGRKTLHIDNYEKVIKLKGMMDGEAKALFIARARLKKPTDWQPSAAEKAQISKIVKYTDRIPLALQLAAAWVDRMPLEDIAEGLKNTPLWEPVGGGISPTERHRNLSRCLDWSYNLLDEKVKKGFVCLGIFPHTFTSDEVKGICKSADIPDDLLFILQDVAIVSPLYSAHGIRYDVHRSTHAYAKEKLKGDKLLYQCIWQRFIEYFSQLVLKKTNLVNESSTTDSEIKAAFNWMEAEWRNIYICVQRASKDANWKVVGDILDAIPCFFLNRGHLQDCESLYLKALKVPEDDFGSARKGMLLNHLGVIYQFQNRWKLAEKYLRDSLILRQGLDKAKTQNSLGTVYQNTKDWKKAKICHERSLKICPLKSSDSDYLMERARTLNNLGWVYESLGLRKKADDVLSKSLEIWKDQLHDHRGVAETLANQGKIQQKREEWPLAKKYYEERLDILRNVGNHMGQAGTLNSIGYVCGQLLDWEYAERCFREALEISINYLKDQSEAMTAFVNLAKLFESVPDLDKAEKVYKENVNHMKGIYKAKALNSLGWFYETHYRWQDAEKHYKKALELLNGFVEWDEEETRTKRNLDRLHERKLKLSSATMPANVRLLLLKNSI